jgi:hypothetical protein
VIRLHIIAEGQTEETFVNYLLVEHLGNFNISTDVRCIETSRDSQRIYRGGLINYTKAKKDIQRWLKEDKNSDARFTTMFDLYGLPEDFPGFENVKNVANSYERIRQLEQAFQEDINDPRFFAYIQLFEFETLILSQPEQFRYYFEDEQKIQQLIAMTKSFVNPELINDSRETAPSKRIIKILPEYAGAKVAAAPIIAQRIGLQKIRNCCNHFNDWLERLENLDRQLIG